MANRIIFFSTKNDSPLLYEEKLVEFDWVRGMAISQGTKSVINLHRAARNEFGNIDILEISTRSQEIEGIKFSAFNLSLETENKRVSVESAYQAAKVFELGGPYVDLMDADSISAKRDPRLKSSGKLNSFQFESLSWPVSLSPNFYDYIYIRGLLSHSNRSFLSKFNAFTDIAFNQITLDYKKGKSFNCQARSAAIFISLLNRMPENQIEDYLMNVAQTEIIDSEQLDLFD